MKNITILDLEKVSGISKSTISRYLRGEGVSDEKSKIIESTIVKTGYIKNNFAQLLRTSKSNLIGVLVPDLDNPFFLTIIKRLDQLAYVEGKSLIIKTTDSDYERELSALSFLRGFRVDGIFFCRSELDDKKIKELNITVPVISIDKKFETMKSVVSNNFTNGYTLTKHVFENTSENVMFFSRIKESSSVKERIAGYKQSCKEMNKDILSYTYKRRNGVDFDRLCKYILDNNIGAIISRNDNEAIKLQSFLNNLYYNDKFKRIRFAGFDNIRLSNHILPKLTTIDQNIENMCNTAYKILNNFDDYKENVYIQESELFIRESTIWR